MSEWCACKQGIQSVDLLTSAKASRRSACLRKIFALSDDDSLR